MKKKETSDKKSLKKKIDSGSRNLFDHLKAIRTSKDPQYYDSLTESEKKGFNHWQILYGLSMDSSLFPLLEILWQEGYYDKIPSNLFYKVLVDFVPKANYSLSWIKKIKEEKKELVQKISSWYSISEREAKEYLKIFLKSDDGLKELISILQGLAMNEKEIEKVLS